MAACPSSSTKGPEGPLNPTPVQEEVTDQESTANAAPVFPEEEFRAAQPAAGEPRPFNLPSITQFKLGKQIDVYLVEDHKLPKVSLELNFDGGTVTDRNKREGTASVCMSMLSEGTKSLDKLAFEEALADIASNVSSYASSESQGVSMRTLSKNFDATFALFTDTLLNPGFRKGELDRMIKRRLESLKQAKGTPRSVAGRLVGSTIYGPKHPFGKITTERSLQSIKVNDCKRFHKSYLKPQGARLFVVGDMTQEQITKAFEPLLAKWKGKPKKVAKLPKPKSRKGRVFFVDIPGSAQSSIYVLHMGPKRSDEHYFANQMMSAVLGGGFSSRINMNLREDKGYSYGARGGFSYNRHYGTFRAASSVRSDSTHQSLLEIFKEMKSIKDNSAPATEVELAREKNGAILGLPSRFATGGQVLSMYRTLVYYGLPMDYYNKFVENYSGVTLEQVTASAAKELHPEDSLILVVGDGSAKQIMRGDGKTDVPMLGSDGKTELTLKEALTQLANSDIGGKGDIVVLDADGNTVKK
jgi:predicted Zn-dependent peptidase